MPPYWNLLGGLRVTPSSSWTLEVLVRWWLEWVGAGVRLEAQPRKPSESSSSKWPCCNTLMWCS